MKDDDKPRAALTKVAQIDGARRADDSRLAMLTKLARDLREQMPAQMEIDRLMAKITRAKYLALVAEGFTADQALMLCK